MPGKMSTSSQNNGKKSSNNSIVNTPASTPLTNIANGNAQVNSLHNSPPPNNNAPKYGTLVPNRIFVGGISANTTEGELMQLFSNYGTVKAAKIIQDRAGVSKGYGFITFESEDDAKRPLREAESIVLRERKLNIAPAIKKQPFSRAFDASSPPTVATGNAAQFFFPPGTPMPYFQGGVAYYPQPGPPGPGDPNAQTPVYQTTPVYPAQTGPPQTASYPSMMFPTQTIYMPQQYPLPLPYEYNYFQNTGATGPAAQYVVGSQGGPGGTQCTPLSSSGSPTRPQCYTQQMPAYNPADPMFYNLPIYGTIEGPPIYPEAFELAPVGSYSEEPYNGITESFPISQEIDVPLNSNSQGVSVTNVVVSTTNSQLDNSSTLDATNNKTKHTEYNSISNEDSSTVRNTSTPVVSLLTLDQQQEKDFLSMQGGRRRKPTNPSSSSQTIPITTRVYASNGFFNSYGIAYQQPPTQPFSICNTNVPQNRPPYNLGYQRRVNGVDHRYNNNNKINKRKNESNKAIFNNEYSNRSSLRTESNSPAACVDENKNEEKTHFRTSVNTPPPAPYSPLTTSFKLFPETNYSNNTKSSYRNSNSSKYNNYNRSNNQNNNYYYDKFKGNNNPSTNSKNGGTTSNYGPNNQNFQSNSQQNSTSQVHVATSQALVPPPSSQGFSGAPPPNIRRNRRTIRRNGPMGGVNEIGAGDAPLPGEVGEVCKKLETIKL